MFTSRDGLRESWTSYVTRGPSGRLWISHGDVNESTSYDGYRFERFPAPGRNLKIKECRHGKVWALWMDTDRFTVLGIQAWFDQAWHTYRIPEMTGLPFASQDPFLPAVDHQVWIVLPDRLAAFEPDSGKLETLLTADETLLGSFRELHAAHDSERFWLMGERGVVALPFNDPDVWLEQIRNAPRLEESVQNASIIHFLQCPGDRFTVDVLSDDRSWKAALGWTGTEWEVLDRTENLQEMVTAWYDRDGRAWQLRGPRPTRMLRQRVEENWIPYPRNKALSGEINSVHVEPDGSFLLATSLCMAIHRPPIWTSPVGLEDLQEFTLCVLEDRAGRIALQTRTAIHLRENDNWIRYPLPGNRFSSMHSRGLSLLADGRICVRTSPSRTLTIFDPATGRFELTPHPERYQISAIHPARDEAVWVLVQKSSSDHALHRFNGSQWETYYEFGDQLGILYPYAIQQTTDGAIWIGAIDGVGLGRIFQGDYKRFGPEEDYRSAGTFTLVEASPGKLWTGDRDSIQEYDGKRWVQIRDRLETVRCLMLDRGNHVWAATGSGIHRFSGGGWTDFSLYEGLPDAAGYGVFESSHGTIWAATSLGVREFHPENDRDPPTTWIQDGANLATAPPNGEVRILFSGSDKWEYTTADRLLFSHRLNDGPWSELDPRTVASFSKLPAGMHRFEVRAIDRAGNTDPDPAVWEFQVLSPWYRSWGFLTSAGASAALLLLLGRMHLSRHQWLRRAVSDRTRALSASNHKLRLEIQERQRLAEQIREQAQLLDQAQEGIFVCDLTLRITYWNRGAESLHGTLRSDAIGKSLNAVLPLADGPDISVEGSPQWRLENPDLTTIHRKTLQNGEWNGRFQLPTSDGRTQVIEARWTLVRSPDDLPQAILAIHSDATEKQRLELQLLRSQRMESIGTLAGGMAHDLNNILAPILLSLELLRQSLSSQEDLDILDVLESNTRRGAELVQQVLVFARGSRSEMTAVELGAVFKDLERILAQSLDSGVVATWTVEPNLGVIRADSTQLHQLLMNLCLNARDAMPDGGQLTITAQNVLPGTPRQTIPLLPPEVSPDRPWVLLSVSDTGVGIPPGIRHRIFDPFFTTKEVGKGTGLGLATVQSIVKNHGGILQVHSTENRGTTFRIWLPALPQDQESGPKIS